MQLVKNFTYVCKTPTYMLIALRIGSPMGALIVGSLARIVGIQTILRVCAIQCVIVGLGYTFIHHLYLKKKPNAILDNNNDMGISFIKYSSFQISNRSYYNYIWKLFLQNPYSKGVIP